MRTVVGLAGLRHTADRLGHVSPRCVIRKRWRAEMNATGVGSSDAGGSARAGSVELKLEVVVIPVADVERAKEFYGRLGWRLDADFPFDNGFRVVQFTPPGSGCSIQFGTDMTSA